MTETPRNLFKRGKTFPKILKEIELGRTLPDKKKRTIRHLMEQQFGTKWEEDEHLDWYRKYCLMLVWISQKKLKIKTYTVIA